MEASDQQYPCLQEAVHRCSTFSEEKELLKVLLRLSASQTNQRIVAMGSPIPMSIINSSVSDIFFAWKEGQPSLRDLQELMRALENLRERMIDFI